jgi:hypothetical protein
MRVIIWKSSQHKAVKLMRSGKGHASICKQSVPAWTGSAAMTAVQNACWPAVKQCSETYDIATDRKGSNAAVQQCGSAALRQCSSAAVHYSCSAMGVQCYGVKLDAVACMPCVPGDVDASCLHVMLLPCIPTKSCVISNNLVLLPCAVCPLQSWAMLSVRSGRSSTRSGHWPTTCSRSRRATMCESLCTRPGAHLLPSSCTAGRSCVLPAAKLSCSCLGAQATVGFIRWHAQPCFQPCARRPKPLLSTLCPQARTLAFNPVPAGQNPCFQPCARRQKPLLSTLCPQAKTLAFNPVPAGKNPCFQPCARRPEPLLSTLCLQARTLAFNPVPAGQNPCTYAFLKLKKRLHCTPVLNPSGTSQARPCLWSWLRLSWRMHRRATGQTASIPFGPGRSTAGTPLGALRRTTSM